MSLRNVEELFGYTSSHARRERYLDIHVPPSLVSYVRLYSAQNICICYSVSLRFITFVKQDIVFVSEEILCYTVVHPATKQRNNDIAKARY
jgi:hypothetical protein